MSLGTVSLIKIKFENHLFYLEEMEHEIDLKKMSHFPNDIKKEVYNYYLDFYRLRMNWNQIHQELTEKEHYLIMTEHLFDFGVDYYYITRIPALESCWSESDIEYID